MLLPGGFPRGAFIFIIVCGIFNACIPHAAVIIHYQQCVRAVLWITTPKLPHPFCKKHIHIYARALYRLELQLFDVVDYKSVIPKIFASF